MPNSVTPVRHSSPFWILCAYRLSNEVKSNGSNLVRHVPIELVPFRCTTLPSKFIVHLDPLWTDHKRQCESSHLSRPLFCFNCVIKWTPWLTGCFCSACVCAELSPSEQSPRLADTSAHDRPFNGAIIVDRYGVDVLVPLLVYWLVTEHRLSACHLSRRFSDHRLFIAISDCSPRAMTHFARVASCSSTAGQTGQPLRNNRCPRAIGCTDDCSRWPPFNWIGQWACKQWVDSLACQCTANPTFIGHWKGSLGLIYLQSNWIWPVATLPIRYHLGNVDTRAHQGDLPSSLIHSFMQIYRFIFITCSSRATTDCGTRKAQSAPVTTTVALTHLAECNAYTYSVWKWHYLAWFFPVNGVDNHGWSIIWPIIGQVASM